MMKKFLLIFSILGILSGVILLSYKSVEAQHLQQSQTPLAVFLGASSDISDECSIDGITQEVNQLLSNAIDVDDLLGELSRFSSIQRANCNDLVFTSQEYGREPVLGPIELPEGIYKVKLTTDGYFIGEYTLLEGRCSDNGFGNNLFLISPNTGLAEKVFHSQGCKLLFQISNTSDDWQLVFELLD